MSIYIKVIFLLITQQFTTSHAKYRIGAGIDPCLELDRSFENLEQALQCCDAMKKIFELIFEFDSCYFMDPDIWSCRKFQCFLESGPNILTNKKDVDPAKGLDMLQKISAKYPDLKPVTKRLRHECFVKNLTQFYNYDNDCPSLNLIYCLAMHSFGECPSWSNSTNCHRMLEGGMMCKPRMDEYARITERLHSEVRSTNTQLTVQESYDPSVTSCRSLTVKYRNLELAKECCPAMSAIFKPIDQAEECLAITPQKWSCKKFSCLLTTGPKILNQDGSIDLKRGRQLLEKISIGNPSLTKLTELLDNECFVKNASTYYRIEDCPAMNLINCFASNLMADCPEWKDDQKCKQLETPAKNCKSFLKFYRKITEYIHSGEYITTIPSEYNATDKEPTFETCDFIYKDYHLQKRVRKCCNEMEKIFGLIEDNHECASTTPGQLTCQRARCYLASPMRGLLLQNGEVNITRARIILYEFMKKNKDIERMARKIEHECIDKNASLYYPVEKPCPAQSFHNCWAMNSFSECSVWSKDPECKTIKAVMKCQDVMEQIRHKTDVLENGLMATEGTLLYPETLTSLMPKSILCSEFISDFTYLSAAEYCCYPMRKIFLKTLHVDERCLNITPGRWTCKKSRCLLNEIPGLLIDDWYINRERGKELLQEIARKYPKIEELTTRMYRECIVKNVTRFYPIGECPAMNLIYCFLVNSLAECTQWNTENTCDKILKNSKKCKREVDKVLVMTEELHNKTITETDIEIEGTRQSETRSDSGSRGMVTVPRVTETRRGSSTKAKAISPYVTTPVDYTKPKCADLHAEYANVELAKYCCEAMEKVLQPLSVNEGCLVISPHQWSCEKMQCLISGVKGLLVKGKINQEVGLEMLDKTAKKYPELGSMTKILAHECFEKNVTRFYPMSSCPANSLMYCLVVNSFAECEVWNQGGGCQEVIESAKNCKRTLDEFRQASDVIHESEKASPSLASPTTELTTTNARRLKDHSAPSCSKLLLSFETLELAKECCGTMKRLFEPLDQLEFCFDINPEEWTCGKFRCFMSGVPNLLINNRDVNPEGGRVMLQEVANKHPDLANLTNLLEYECFVKNVSVNYPVHKCMAYQYMYCLASNSFAECTTWSDRTECKPLTEMSRNCKKQMDVERAITDKIHEKQFTTTVKEEATTRQTTALPEGSLICTDLGLDYEKLTIGVQCCKAIDVLFEPLFTNEVCESMPEEWSCMKARCYLYAIPNMLLKNKMINKTVGHEMLRQLAEKHPNMAHMTKIIDHECLIKDANEFYKVNSKCPQHNVVYCMVINSFAECPSWSDDLNCREIKESAQQCQKAALPERERTDEIFYGDQTEPSDLETKTTITTGTTPKSVKDTLCPDITSEFQNLDSAKECCDPMMKLFDPFFSKKLCLDISPGKWTCEKARCLLEAAGLLVNSRFINKAAGLKLLDRIAKKHSEMAPMAQIIERECFIKNASRFYPFNVRCPPQNFMFCFMVNSFAECPSWNNRPDCEPVKDSSRRCRKVMEPIRAKTDEIHFGRTTTKQTAIKEITTITKNKGAVLCQEISTKFDYFKTALQCCKPMMYLFEPFSNDCDDIAPSTWTCEKARCFLSKADLLIKSRYVDEDAGRVLMQRIANQHPETTTMVKIIQHECFTKNSTRFYPISNKCPSHNLMYCLIVNSFSECPSWSDESTCKPLVELSRKCKRRLDKVRAETDKIYSEHTPTTTTTTIASVTPVDFTKPQCPELHASFDAFEQAKVCCISMQKIFDDIMNDNKICLILNKNKNWACDKLECLLSTVNLLTRHYGHKYTVNKDAGRKWLQTISQKHPEIAPMTKVIEKECFGKDVTRFYPTNNCISSSLMYCLAVNSYADCPQWIDSNKNCHPVIEDSKICKKSLDYARNESDYIDRENVPDTSTTPPTTETTVTRMTHSDDYHYCLRIMHVDNLQLAKDCCAPFTKVMDIFEEKEYCSDVHPDTWYSCVKLNCLMTAVPNLVIESESTVNVTVGKQVFMKLLKKYPDYEPMIKYMSHECYEKNFKRFYNVDKCQLVNNFHCLVTNGVAECPLWSEKSECKSIKEISRKCQKNLDAYRKLTDEMPDTQLEMKPDPTEACNIIHESIKKLKQLKDCCDGMKRVFESTENKACDIIEPQGAWSCKRMKCLLGTYPGLLTEQSEINANVGQEMLAKVSKQYPGLEPLIASLKEECFKEEYLNKTCPAFTFTYCLALRSFAECPSWKDSAACQPYVEISNKCKAGLADQRQQKHKHSLSGSSDKERIMYHPYMVVVVTIYVVAITI